MGEDFSLDSSIEKSISNKICFEFFTYFIETIIREKEKAGSKEEIENDRIGKFHYSYVEKWNRFQKNNKEFEQWYKNWISAIAKFEEANLKLFKENNFLTV